MSCFFLPELLAPAGNLEKLRTCLLYGADAVYLGGRTGNLRAACTGFSAAELETAVAEARSAGARVYYCLNSLPLQRDLAALPAALEEAAGAGVHGLIVADPGLIRLARRYAPGVDLHLSTQANTTNSEGVAFWAEQGISRVNLARELSAREIHAVRKACPEMELEVFVHGAMCLAVSGQCLLSAWLNNRSGNQGRCTQPCRFEYRGQYTERLCVEEHTRPGETLWRVEEDEPFSSFWAPQDLCLLPWLPWFFSNRVNALKIEGRMKSAGWLAHVVDAYRTALSAISGRRRAADPRAADGMPAGSQASGSQALGSQAPGCQVSGCQALGSQAPGSQATGCQALGSQAPGSQATGCQAPGPQAPDAQTPGTQTPGAQASGCQALFALVREGAFTSRRYLEELLYAATRPLGTGFFLPGRRRNLSEEALARLGVPARKNRSGESALPVLGHALLARVLEPEGNGVWRVEVRGDWARRADVELMLPGLERPVLIGGSYGLENQRGELCDCIGNGTRGRLYADVDGIRPGVFIRAAE